MLGVHLGVSSYAYLNIMDWYHCVSQQRRKEMLCIVEMNIFFVNLRWCI